VEKLKKMGAKAKNKSLPEKGYKELNKMKINYWN
jgi:hypothetical protein